MDPHYFVQALVVAVMAMIVFVWVGRIMYRKRGTTIIDHSGPWSGETGGGDDSGKDLDR